MSMDLGKPVLTPTDNHGTTDRTQVFLVSSVLTT